MTTHNFQDFWQVKNQVKMLTVDQVNEFKVCVICMGTDINLCSHAVSSSCGVEHTVQQLYMYSCIMTFPSIHAGHTDGTPHLLWECMPQAQKEVNCILQQLAIYLFVEQNVQHVYVASLCNQFILVLPVLQVLSIFVHQLQLGKPIHFTCQATHGICLRYLESSSLQEHSGY